MLFYNRLHTPHENVLLIFVTHVAEIRFCPHTNIQQQTRKGKLSGPVNWDSPLADLPSSTDRVNAMMAESCSLSATRVGLVIAQTARTHLADITAEPESLLPQQPQLGNRNLATSHSMGDWLGEQCSERWIRRSIIAFLGAEGHAGSELCQTLSGWWIRWNNDDSPGLNLA